MFFSFFFELNFWIQTCNFKLFFLCKWRNKTYLLTYFMTHQDTKMSRLGLL